MDDLDGNVVVVPEVVRETNRCDGTMAQRALDAVAVGDNNVESREHP
jgi:hypothetical protein